MTPAVTVCQLRLESPIYSWKGRDELMAGFATIKHSDTHTGFSQQLDIITITSWQGCHLVNYSRRCCRRAGGGGGVIKGVWVQFEEELGARQTFKSKNHVHGHVSSGREIMSTAVLMPHIVIIKYGMHFHHFLSSLTCLLREHCADLATHTMSCLTHSATVIYSDFFLKQRRQQGLLKCAWLINSLQGVLTFIMCNDGWKKGKKQVMLLFIYESC